MLNARPRYSPGNIYPCGIVLNLSDHWCGVLPSPCIGTLYEDINMDEAVDHRHSMEDMYEGVDEQQQDEQEQDEQEQDEQEQDEQQQEEQQQEEQQDQQEQQVASEDQQQQQQQQANEDHNEVDGAKMSGFEQAGDQAYSSGEDDQQHQPQQQQQQQALEDSKQGTQAKVVQRRVSRMMSKDGSEAEANLLSGLQSQDTDDGEAVAKALASAAAALDSPDTRQLAASVKEEPDTGDGAKAGTKQPAAAVAAGGRTSKRVPIPIPPASSKPPAEVGEGLLTRKQQRQQQQQQEEEEPPINATMLYLSNLTWWTTDKDVEEVAKAFGEVQQLRFLEDRATGKSRGVAVVEFLEPTAAVKCKEKLNG